MMYRPSTAFLLVFLAVTTAVFSQTRPAKPAPPLWGKALPAQPFDTQTFREIALPDWLEETTRVTYCYSVMSAAMRDRATQAGSQVSEMGFVSPFYANYPSAILNKRDPNLQYLRQNGRQIHE